MDNNNKSFSIDNIVSYLQESLNISEEVCKVYFSDKNGNFWSFYLREGFLIWATQHEHPLKRLHRIVSKICPQINSREIHLRETERSELWEYLAIKVLYQRQKINLEQATSIVQEYTSEVLFDCYQNNYVIHQAERIHANSHDFMGAILRHPLLKAPLVKIDFLSLHKKVLKSWQDWQNAGLEKYSPNLALVIKNQNQFKQSTEQTTYQKLNLLINGTRTIRDLSILTRKEPLALMNTFIPYIHNDLMELKAIPDENIPQHTSAKTNPQQSSLVVNSASQLAIDSLSSKNKPLIICIDDSPMINAQMKSILERENYRVILVQEVHQALTTMLENKPDLIFLDLVMPIANGYEICAQIRRMSSVQDVPVIILSGNDGLLDRLRAKMVGASDFINKPIETDKILAITHKYLKNHQECAEKDPTLIQQKA